MNTEFIHDKIEFIDEESSSYFVVPKAIFEVGLKADRAWLYCCIADFASILKENLTESKIITESNYSRLEFDSCIADLEAANMVKIIREPGAENKIILTKPSSWIFKA